MIKETLASLSIIIAAGVAFTPATVSADNNNASLHAAPASMFTLVDDSSTNGTGSTDQMSNGSSDQSNQDSTGMSNSDQSGDSSMGSTGNTGGDNSSSTSPSSDSNSSE